ncbi:hypothetical protein A6A06_30200 [Streptomyces sp. CB02923]|uniref:hypothetical protein n=1 Tax=Streptomyces sp. CB02923 TaxID=1718985 RepID=UPI000939BFB1|nr:hypothetical protein [Streptomyces sp. CB02923]OKH98444.1 hypothetical protein A6A06_30200 [Streptomyces sp. CB02923]
MPFHCALRAPGAPVRHTGGAVEVEDPDDYTYLAMTASGLLAEAGYGFTIGGFGTEHWNFDVAYDMSALLEQLPEIQDSLRRGVRYEADLYPQGVERGITFSPSGSTVELRCASRTSWVPDPDTEVHERASLEAMFDRLTHDVASGLRSVCPQVAGLRPFRDWR